MSGSTQRFVGIDFSGAKDAGKHIWITQGKESAGTLQVSSCEQAMSILSGGNDRDMVFKELVRWIDSLQNATIGIDFPFSVPKMVVEGVIMENTWMDFIHSPKWSNLSPKIFRDQSTNLCGNKLRDTDAMHGADCPYSIRTYKQTFYGISKILRPLIQNDVSIAPFFDGNRDVTILETYPAATLAKEDMLFAIRYKYQQSTRSRRQHNVNELASLSELDLSGIDTRKVVDNTAGDALDSIVAALATFRASNNSSPFTVTPHNPVEGHIFT